MVDDDDVVKVEEKTRWSSEEIVIEAQPGPKNAPGGDLRLMPGAGAGDGPDGCVIICKPDGDPMVTIHPSGQVDLHKPFEQDEAVLAFWSALGRRHPMMDLERYVAVCDAYDEAETAWRRSAPKSFYGQLHNGNRLKALELARRHEDYFEIARIIRRYLKEMRQGR